MRNYKLILIFSFLIISFRSSGYYELDKKLDNAYNLILSLKLDDAGKLLSQEAVEKPNNNLVLLYQNYIDFLKAFITDDALMFDKLKSNSQKRLDLLKDNKSNDASPFHLYAQAEILIQQALVRIKFEENIISAGEIRKAYKLIEKNNQLFPSFILNNKVRGFLHAIVGSVPPKYQWLVKLAGMTGTLSEGLNEMKLAYDGVQNTQYQSYQLEIIFYLGNIYSVFTMAPDSLPIVDLMREFLNKSPLITYVYSNIMLKIGKNIEALSALNSALEDKSRFPFYFLYYKRGVARLRKLDLSATEDFDRFLHTYTGNNNIKSAYQKLAWIDLIKGDTLAYAKHLSDCLTKGRTLLDEDKDAYSEALQNLYPNLYLLKSRLLFDGGYYTEAMREISGQPLTSFPAFRDKLEVTYRMGRILHKTGNIKKAIYYYEQTLKNGMSYKYYFAANSALLLGNIYEDAKQFDLADEYYRKCLTLEYDQYKNGIDQKAQAGLERLRSK